MTKWRYIPEVEDSKQRGIPANKLGWLITNRQPSNEKIKEIAKTRDALQKFLEDHNIMLDGDYEGDVYIEFDGGNWDIDVYPTSGNEFRLLSRGRLAGIFKRIRSND